MGSSYFGEPNMGNERGAAGSSSSSSSSRRGKKSNSDKPKTPQRGLGVAQLEKIRLHGQMASSTFLPLHHHHHHHTPFPANFNQMGLGEYDQRVNIRYSDSQPSTTASWNPNSGILESQHFVQPNMTRQLLNLQDSHSKKTKKHRSNSLGSSSQNSESSDTQDLDLELRLSL